MAENLGVGRPTLREALRALQLLGIVDIRHGGGVYVAAIEPDTLLGPLHLYISLDRHSVKTIFEARKVIEGAVLAFVAKDISSELITRLKGNLQKFERTIEKLGQEGSDPLQVNVLAQEFRDIVEEACDNPILNRALRSLDILSDATRTRLTEVKSAEQLLLNHKRIVGALLAHDPQQAQRAAEAHIDYLSECCEKSDSGRKEKNA